MRPVLIVKTGTAAPSALRRGDFEQWITAGLGLEPTAVEVRRVDQGASLPSPREIAAAVVTGSSAMVTDAEPWSELTAAWLRDVVAGGTAVLGICYGHQLLAHALGGEVGQNPRGRCLGTIDVVLTPAARTDALFAELPEALHVAASHRQVVTRLPPDATLLAEASHDRHYALRVGSRAWSVQFHPEFDAETVRAYIGDRREQLIAEGLDPDALARNARDSDDGTRLLRRFAAIVRDGERG